MASGSAHAPVKDTVPKVNNEIAVGADLSFQYKWWRFESAVWIFFTLLVILDFFGAFGKGYLANAELENSDGSLNVKYERIERLGTSSILTVRFGQSALNNHSLKLWVSDSPVSTLGAERLIPQPASSVLHDGGILYTFPASNLPSSAEFDLHPVQSGSSNMTLLIPGHDPLNLSIFVMP